MNRIIPTGALIGALLLAVGCQPAAEDNDDAGGVNGGSDGGALPDEGLHPDVGVGPDDDARARLLGATTEYLCAYIRTCRHFSDDLNIAHGLDAAGGDCPAYFARNPPLFREAFETDHPIDVAAFERCAARSLETCAELDDFAACDAVVTGTRADGEGCDNTEDCGAGLYCDRDAGDVDGGQCADICAAQLQPGSPCRSNAECATVGEFRGVCHADVCAGLTVRAGAGLGEPCGYVDEGGEPLRITCAQGLYCPAGPAGRAADVCRVLPALGEPCGDFDVPCDGGVCGFDGVCVPWTVRTAEGQPCSPFELQFCGAMHGLACVDGLCRATDGGEGEPCLADPLLGRGCRAGLDCDEGLCVRRLASGEPCTDEDRWRCASLICGEDDTCAPAPEPCR